MFDQKKLKQIREELDQWQEKEVDRVLGKHPERSERFETSFGESLERLYSPHSVENADYLEDLGFPGSFPFTRGVQPTMYRGKLWTMRQYAGFGTAQESNKRYRYLLSQGQTGLSVAFDLPTQIGFDSDHEMSDGEVGRVGVAISSLGDMETLFDGIPLAKVSTSMTINSTAAILLAMYVAVAEKQGVKPEQLKGTIQNDILKEYIARGTYIFPPEPSMKIITDIFEYCSENLPLFNTISVSGYHIREAGADAVQEVAFTLADGIEYVKAAIDANLDPDVFGKRISFFFGAHNNFFEEIAKFRAARRLWARIMKERFGATDKRALMMRFHTQTAGSTLTAQQPQNNIVRVAYQALAAVLGGTQSLHTNSFDEAIGLPTEESVRVALRTQQLIAHETGVTDSVDPLGGSYLVEYLTNRIEEQASSYIEKIDELGGMIRAIEEGYVQREILDTAYRTQKEIEGSDRVVVGMNKFTSEHAEVPEDILELDESVEKKQHQSLAELRETRNADAVRKSISRLQKAAENGENIMPSIIEAVSNYATLGEITSALKDIFGEYTESVII